MCVTNYDLSSFLKQKITQDLRSAFEIQEAAEKFDSLHQDIQNNYLMDLVSGMQDNFVRPFLRDRESEQVIQGLLTERKKVLQEYEALRRKELLSPQ
jgi:hypothetical protein